MASCLGRRAKHCDTRRGGQCQGRRRAAATVELDAAADPAVATGVAGAVVTAGVLDVLPAGGSTSKNVLVFKAAAAFAVTASPTSAVLDMGTVTAAPTGTQSAATGLAVTA